jgi:hypothetical protein
MDRAALTIPSVTVWIEAHADIRAETDLEGCTWLHVRAPRSVTSLGIALEDRATVAKLHGVLTRVLDLLDDPRAAVCKVCRVAEPDQLGGTCRDCQDAIDNASPTNPDLAPDRDEEE